MMFYSISGRIVGVTTQCFESLTKGFTLAKLLIVVAVIGVLVAISVPIFSSQLHKAKVATDWANLRVYYAEIQADYISTGKYNPKVNHRVSVR